MNFETTTHNLPTPDVLYRALAARDSAFDGLFVAGVISYSRMRLRAE